MTELSAGKIWGCKRAHFEANDLTGHPKVTIEVKARTRDLCMPRQWLEQAEAAVEEGKVAIVHFHHINHSYKDDLVIMKASVLRDIIGVGQFYDSATDPTNDEWKKTREMCS